MAWGKLSALGKASRHTANDPECRRVDGRGAATPGKVGRFWRIRCMENPEADVSFSIKSPSEKSSRRPSEAVKVNLSSWTSRPHQSPAVVCNAAQEAELIRRIDDRQGAQQCAYADAFVRERGMHIGRTKAAGREIGNEKRDAIRRQKKTGGDGACNISCTEVVCTDQYPKRGVVHRRGEEEPLPQSVVSKVPFKYCLDGNTDLPIRDRVRNVDCIPQAVVEQDNDDPRQLKYVGARRAQVRAAHNDGHGHCPLSDKAALCFEHGWNDTVNAPCFSHSSFISPGSGSALSQQNSFSSCMSTLSCCPSSATSVNNERPTSYSSFSISKLLEGMELESFSTCLPSSLPKLFMNPELDSLASSCTGTCSTHSKRDLQEMCIKDHCSTSNSIRSLPHAEQESHSSQEIDGANPTLGETSSRQWGRLLELTSLSRKPLEYRVFRINGLVSDLHSDYPDIQRSAAAELRLLAKHEDSNRILIAKAGGLKPLINMLCSRDPSLQLDATTAVLNLSLNQTLKEVLANAGAIEGLVRALQDGLNEMVQSNAAAALAYLAACEVNKSKIGSAGAITPLVSLLERGSMRGKKDAAAALYKLSPLDENKNRMIRARILRFLVEFMYTGEDKEPMVDKAMAIVTNLVSIEEGRAALVEEGGIMSLLHVIKAGSQKSLRLAVPILFQLCTHDSKYQSLVQQSEALPSLMSAFKIASYNLKLQIAEMIDALIVGSG